MGEVRETDHPWYDKANWGPGPWQDEADEYRWTTEAGLPGRIARNPVGCLCGYVAVRDGHPLFGAGYDTPDVSVHGGLTYSRDNDQAEWEFGFDCAHAGDYMPFAYAMANEPHAPKFMKALRWAAERDDTYRDVAYVKAEVESLAHQLVTLGKEPKR